MNDVESTKDQFWINNSKILTEAYPILPWWFSQGLQAQGRRGFITNKTKG
jgi:hypothetical protein